MLHRLYTPKPVSVFFRNRFGTLVNLSAFAAPHAIQCIRVLILISSGSKFISEDNNFGG